MIDAVTWTQLKVFVHCEFTHRNTVHVQYSMSDEASVHRFPAVCTAPVEYRCIVRWKCAQWVTAKVQFMLYANAPLHIALQFTM